MKKSLVKAHQCCQRRLIASAMHTDHEDNTVSISPRRILNTGRWIRPDDDDQYVSPVEHADLQVQEDWSLKRGWLYSERLHDGRNYVHFCFDQARKSDRPRIRLELPPYYRREGRLERDSSVLDWRCIVSRVRATEKKTISRMLLYFFRLQIDR